MKYTREQAIAVFWSKVATKSAEECWLWTGFSSNAGYGLCWFQGKTVSVHRLAFFVSGGILLENQEVCHTCDTPLCCNPLHLFGGTHKQNRQDCAEKGRIYRGERHHFSKITQSGVEQLRKEREHGVTYKKLGEKYGMSSSSAYQICKHLSWKHV